MPSPSDLVGSIVRTARLARGLTQAGLASLADVRRETVHRIERGRPGSADSLARIADALELAREDLIIGDPFASRLYGHPWTTRLRDRRRNMNLTLAECAAAAGVSVTTLSRFERGNSYYPSLCVVDRRFPATAIHNEGLARVLGFRDAAELTSFWRCED